MLATFSHELGLVVCVYMGFRFSFSCFVFNNFKKKKNAENYHKLMYKTNLWCSCWELIFWFSTSPQCCPDLVPDLSCVSGFTDMNMGVTLNSPLCVTLPSTTDTLLFSSPQQPSHRWVTALPAYSRNARDPCYGEQTGYRQLSRSVRPREFWECASDPSYTCRGCGAVSGLSCSGVCVRGVCVTHQHLHNSVWVLHTQIMNHLHWDSSILVFFFSSD